MIFAAVVIYVKGNDVNTYPFLVKAKNYNEAVGITHACGMKLCPKGWSTHIKVSSNIEPITTAEGVCINEDCSGS